MEEQSTNNKQSLAIPVAIVLAGALVASALYLRGGSSVSPTAAVNEFGQKKEAIVKPVGPDDHILGNPQAELIVVEYSDTECPFCKNFHKTMQQIIAEYGKDGKVAWVYRHMPLEQLHKKAMREAIATECAAEVGGKAKFWDYINELFERTPSNDGLDLAELPKIAKDVGLNVDAFNKCLDSGKFDEKLQNAVREAVEAGAEGTPYSVIIAKNGDTYPIPGYVPYTEFKSIIEGLLKGN